PRPPQTSLNLAEAAVTAWAAGSWLFLLALVAANARFAARLQRSRQPLEADSPLPAYLTEAVDSPCLFGLPTPSIYVTAEAAADAAALPHVLRHEQTHARHLDHIWAALRALALVLHWYNPLVWLAASLSRRDAELACDEATVAALGEEARSDYGRTLIALSCAKGGAGSLLTAATTMTGGRRTIKERITLLAKNPKTALGTFLLVTALAAVAVGCTFTGAEEGHDFSEWTATLTAEEIQWAELSRGYGVDVLSYTVPEAEYEALCTLLGGITDDQCHRRNPAGDDIDGTRLALYRRDKLWLFKCLDDGTVGLMFHDPETGAYFGSEGKLLILESPELYQFIMETVEEKGQPVAGEIYADNIPLLPPLDPATLPDELVAYARHHVMEVARSCMGLGENPPVGQEGYQVTDVAVTGLTEVPLGALALKGLSLWRLEYRIWVDQPENVILKGGMRVESGAITEWSLAGQPHILTLTKDGETSMMMLPASPDLSADILSEIRAIRYYGPFAHEYTYDSRTEETPLLRSLLTDISAADLSIETATEPGDLAYALTFADDTELHLSLVDRDAGLFQLSLNGDPATGRPALCLTSPALAEQLVGQMDKGFGADVRLLLPGDQEDTLPQSLLDYARFYTASAAHSHVLAGEQNPVDIGPYKVTEVAVTGLPEVPLGPAAVEEGLRLYRLEYRIRVDEPQRVILAGGMRMEGDAITEWESMGQPHLLTFPFLGGTEILPLRDLLDGEAIIYSFDSEAELTARLGEGETRLYTAAALAAYRRHQDQITAQTDPDRLYLKWHAFYKDEVERRTAAVRDILPGLTVTGALVRDGAPIDGVSHPTGADGIDDETLLAQDNFSFDQLSRFGRAQLTLLLPESSMTAAQFTPTLLTFADWCEGQGLSFASFDLRLVAVDSLRGRRGSIEPTPWEVLTDAAEAPEAERPAVEELFSEKLTLFDAPGFDPASAVGLTPPPLEEVLAALFAKDGAQITLHEQTAPAVTLDGGVAYDTLPLDAATFPDRLRAILDQSQGWTPLPDGLPLMAAGTRWVSVESPYSSALLALGYGGDGVDWLAIDLGDAAGLSVWGDIVAPGINDPIPSLALRWEYAEQCVDSTRVAFFHSGTPEQAAEQFARTAWGSHLQNQPAGERYGIEGFELISHEILEVDEENLAVLGRMVYAVLPERYEDNGWWAGNSSDWEGHPGWLK
ncbi:MAG: M56 family metallopeptidase, partial [Clostridia bacterium]|nr:M56 family metallopeptidase [Clostridia bacterium]